MHSPHDRTNGVAVTAPDPNAPWHERMPAVVAFVVATAIWVALYAAGVYSVSADESTRTLHALRGSQPDMVWLPLLRIVDHAALTLWHAPILVPRLVSLVAGLAVLAAVMDLARALGYPQRVRTMAAVLAAISADRIVLAQIPLPEIVFIALLVEATASHLRYARTGSYRAALTAAVAMGLASALRYEAWLFVGAFVCAMVFATPAQRLRRTRIVALAASGVAIAFPVAWLLLGIARAGWPPAFLGVPGATFDAQYGRAIGLRILASAAVMFAIHGGWSLYLVALPEVRAAMSRDRWMRPVFFVPIAALVGLTGLALAGRGLPTHDFWRIASVWLILLIPFVSACVDRLASTRLRVMALCALAVTSATRVFFVAHDPYTDHDDVSAGRALDALLMRAAPQDRALVDSIDFTFASLLVMSSDPDRVIVNTGWGAAHDVMPVVDARARPSVDALCALRLVAIAAHSRELRDWMDALSHEGRVAPVFRSTRWDVFGLRCASSSWPSPSRVDGDLRRARDR